MIVEITSTIGLDEIFKEENSKYSNSAIKDYKHILNRYGLKKAGNTYFIEIKSLRQFLAYRQ